jgi:broad specificity phosphatase PhoE
MDNVSVVIVTHGLALRLFLMRWFQWSVECFEESQNPGNCELVTMNKRKDDEGHAWMELEEKDRQSLCLSDACAVPRNVHLHRKKSVLHYPSSS